MPPPPKVTCGFLIQLVFCKKKTMWFIGVEVEQETSAPSPKKILDPPLETLSNSEHMFGLSSSTKSLDLCLFSVFYGTQPTQLVTPLN